MRRAVAASHSRTVSSPGPAQEITRLPSGVKAAHSTQALCPRKHCTSRPLPTSHRRMVLSKLLDSNFLPSAEKATLVISASCPWKEQISLPLPRFHSRKVLGACSVAKWPAASHLPSGDNARQR